MEEGGNFRDESIGAQSSGNILHSGHDFSETDRISGMSREELQTGLETIRTTLIEVRNRRPRPLRDEKILADWNGLMITAFARAASAFDREDLCERAERAADFIWKTMRDEEGRLFHRWRDGEAAVSAFADDSIFFTRGLIDLFEITQNPVYLSRALELSDDLDHRFWDDGRSGYYFTAHDAETLLFRKKESDDGAVPSGNSIALSNLFRLARMTGRSALEEKAQRLAGAFAPSVIAHPEAHTRFLCGLERILFPSSEITVCGLSGDQATRDLLRTLRQSFLPRSVLLFVPAEEDNPSIQNLAPRTKVQVLRNNRPTVYVCQGSGCHRPVHTAEEALRLIRP
jgi:uncharacterized protein YyaL (SSP411 family)